MEKDLKAQRELHERKRQQVLEMRQRMLKEKEKELKTREKEVQDQWDRYLEEKAERARRQQEELFRIDLE